MIRALPHGPWSSRRMVLEATIVVLIAALIVTAGHLFPATLFDARVRLSVHASIIATVTLGASGLLYVGHTLLREPSLGRCASSAAALGASILLGASIARWWEVQWLAFGALQFSARYELLTWMAVLCVYGYLWTEDVYETRSAGAFLLGSVLAALTVAAWLIGAAPLPDPVFSVLTIAYLDGFSTLTATASVVSLAAVILETAWMWRVRLAVAPRNPMLMRVYPWTVVVALSASAAYAALVAAGRLLPDARTSAALNPWLAWSAGALAIGCYGWRWRRHATSALPSWITPALALAGILGWLTS